MGSLKADQTHLVVLEVKGSKQKNITSYMKLLRAIAATYGATVTASQKIGKARPAAKRKRAKAAKKRKR